MTIVEFLEARLAEDEAVALAITHIQDSKLGEWTGKSAFLWILGDQKVSNHIARHDPARVLREVAAKRAIIAEHHRASQWGGPVDVCDAHDGATMATIVCDTMLALAAVYSDHPDYREDWS